ncbi:MAG: ATP-binding protein [Phycisphaerae bacterium]
MRDLSLHILDLIENSIRAKATAVRVTVWADPARDRLSVIVEDNGPGLKVPARVAVDPFYTTKGGKKTGLGLGLFQATTQRAGGNMTLRRSALGGLAVAGWMRLGHVDRSPLGDLAATISTVVCTNPDLHLRVILRAAQTKWELDVKKVARELAADKASPLISGIELATRVSELMKARLALWDHQAVLM